MFHTLFPSTWRPRELPTVNQLGPTVFAGSAMPPISVPDRFTVSDMRFGLDYAAGRPGGAVIRAAGFDFVVRYLSDGGLTLPGKLLTPAEADDLRADRVSIVSN
jgi:hypothetical protein